MRNRKQKLYRVVAHALAFVLALGSLPARAIAEAGPVEGAASVEYDGLGMVVSGEEPAVAEVEAEDLGTWEATAEAMEDPVAQVESDSEIAGVEASAEEIEPVEPDDAVGSLSAQDYSDDGPTLYSIDHDPDPSLASLGVQIKSDSYGEPSDGDWSGWDGGEGVDVEDFDPTQRNKIYIIEVEGSCDEVPIKAKFRWSGLKYGGGTTDIYELVQGPYQKGERHEDEFGNTVADYEVYYSEAFTRKNVDLNDEILGMYHFKVVYHLIVEPGERTDLSSATVTLDQDEFVYYNPVYARPVPTVTLGGKVLSPGTDYAVAHYLNNVNVGTGTVVIKGKGGYSGTVSADFHIAKAQNTLGVVAASPSVSVTYDPSAAHVLASNVVVETGFGDVTYRNVTPSGSGARMFEVDGATGKVTIPRGTRAGTYVMRLEVTAAGDKNYERGSAIVSYDIVVGKAANTLTAKAAKASVSVTYNPKAATVTAKNVAVSNAQGAVTYANASTDATAGKFVVDKVTGKVTVPKATKVGTYLLKVKATAAGDANHKSGSKTVGYKVVVKKAKNPITAKAVKRTAKLAVLKKKAVTVKCPMVVSKAKGKVTYAKVAKGSAKCLTVNKKTGKVTVKQGTKKGTYKIKIKVKAKGNANYKVGSKTITCKVTVK